MAWNDCGSYSIRKRRKGFVVDSTTQLLSLIIILLALALYLVSAAVRRRRRDAFPMRAMPAYDAMPLMVGAAIEANRPVHVSLGSAGLGSGNTPLTLVSAELFYRVGQRAAINDSPTIMTMSDPTAIPLGYDTLRRAYASRGRLGQYRASGARWYPAGVRSLTFAAALTATMGVEDVGANVLVGSFGPEIALMADAAYRHNQTLIAASDQLEGQAVAYALADQPLIGEEIFMAGAYLGTEAGQRAGAAAQDALRWLLIIAIVGAALFTALGGR